jgi:hypothetical protein
MNKNDQAFNEKFKPLVIPTKFEVDAPEKDKVIFALAHIENGTAYQVANKLHELEPLILFEDIEIYCRDILTDLYNSGLIKGVENGGRTSYNLSKIQEMNTGKINPELIE